MVIRKIIDVNCRFGEEPLAHYYQARTPQDLLVDMDYYHIDQAMVYHSVSTRHPGDGNELCVNEISKLGEAGKNRLHPVSVYQPYPNQPQLYNAELYVKQLFEKGYKSVLLEIKHVANPTPVMLLSPVLARLAERKIPVMLKYAARTVYSYEPNWNHLIQLLESFPEIPFILVDIGYNANYGFYPLADRYDNFYMEISGYQGFNQIEHFCQTFTSEKLLFGSHFPVFSPGSSLYKILEGELDQQDKENILFGNAERLFELRDVK